MPLYEYRCSPCGHRFEILQRMGEGGEGLACPCCGAEGPAKQYSTFSGLAGGAAPEPRCADAPPGGCCLGTGTCPR